MSNLSPTRSAVLDSSHILQQQQQRQHHHYANSSQHHECYDLGGRQNNNSDNENDNDNDKKKKQGQQQRYPKSRVTYPVVLAVRAKEFDDLGLLLRLRHPQHALVDAPVLACVFVADLLRDEPQFEGVRVGVTALPICQ